MCGHLMIGALGRPRFCLITSPLRCGCCSSGVMSGCSSVSLGEKLAGQQLPCPGTRSAMRDRCGAGAGLGRGWGRRPSVQGEEAEAPPVQHPRSSAPWAASHLGASVVSHDGGHQEGQKARPREDAFWGTAAWQSSCWGGCTVTLRWGQEVGGRRVGSRQGKGRPRVSRSPKPCLCSDSEGPGPELHPSTQ